jgi:sterol desaturase/sphingolipid hydroxylase (fatty acid hydroxylase superfamily)
VILPAEGFGLIPAALAYIVTIDLLEYLFHRAQHAIPVLWAMHSLHHSDPAVNVSTTSRHFWLEQAIKSVTIYLAASLIFAASPMIIIIYAAVAYCNFFTHMNLRVGFGRFVLLNSPQNHRIHHSSEPLHRDKNFAALFFRRRGGHSLHAGGRRIPGDGARRRRLPCQSHGGDRVARTRPASP